MPRTQVTGDNILDGSIQLKDLDTTTPGQAVVRTIIAGSNVSISSSGVDPGTGDVTINLSSSGGGFDYEYHQKIETLLWMGL